MSRLFGTLPTAMPVGRGPCNKPDACRWAPASTAGAWSCPSTVGERVRRKKRGPRTRKNRPRYHTDWREPKLLILYVVGADGRPCQQWSPIIDGTLQGPDAVVALVQSYATQIELGAADTVLFIADGAPWIWNRIGALVDALTLRPDQVLTLIDFYFRAPTPRSNPDYSTRTNASA